MKGGKHRLYKIPRCRSLYWKLAEGAQSFVFFWQIVME